MSYRANPALDLQILHHRDQGHGPRSKRNDGEDASWCSREILDACPPCIEDGLGVERIPFVEIDKRLVHRVVREHPGLEREHPRQRRDSRSSFEPDRLALGKGNDGFPLGQIQD